MKLSFAIVTSLLILAGSLHADEADTNDKSSEVPESIVFFRQKNTAIRDEVTNRIILRSSEIPSAVAVVAKHDDGKQLLVAWSVTPLKMGYVPADAVCTASEAEAYYAGRLLGNPADRLTIQRKKALAEFQQARGKATANTIGTLCRKMADALSAAGRNQEALEWAERAVHTAPKDPYTHFARAQVEYDLLMHDEAIRDYKEAVRLSPRFHQSWTGIGNIHLYRQQFQEAVEAYSKAMSNEPDSLTFYNRARAYAELKKLDEAIDDASEAVRLNSRYTEAWFLRAQCYRTQKKFEEAIPDFDMALKTKPSAVGIYVERGSTYYALQRYDKAEEDYSKAINGRAQHKSLHGWRCLTRLKQKKWDAALEDAEICLKETPTAWVPHKYAAQACEGKKDFAKAIEYYEAAIRLRPNDNTVLNSVAWIMCSSPELALRNGARAVELATKGCELTNWEDMNVIDTLAAAYAEDGNFEEAIRYQKLALEKTDEESRAGMETRLKLFESGQTYTAAPEDAENPAVPQAETDKAIREKAEKEPTGVPRE